jgi:hypothetical protein
MPRMAEDDLDSSTRCRVCGLDLGHRPWGDDGHSPSFEICPCCGAEIGYKDCTRYGVRAARRAWLDGDAQWFAPGEQPRDWNLERQLAQVPDEFRRATAMAD